MLYSRSLLVIYFIYEVKWSEVSQSCLTLCEPMDTRLLRPWDFLGKSTGVGCHLLLQGIFPTQGSNPGLLHCRQTLYHLSHEGSPKSLYCLIIRINISPVGEGRESRKREWEIQRKTLKRQVLSGVTCAWDGWGGVHFQLIAWGWVLKDFEGYAFNLQSIEIYFEESRDISYFQGRELYELIYVF